MSHLACERRASLFLTPSTLPADPTPPNAAGAGASHLYANALSPNASKSPVEAQACVWPYQSGIATFELPHVLSSTASTYQHQHRFDDHWTQAQLPIPELRVEDFTAAALPPAEQNNHYIYSGSLSPHPAVSAFSPFFHSNSSMDAHVSQVMPEFSKSSGPVSPVSMNEDVTQTMPPAAQPPNPRKRKLSDVSLPSQLVHQANSQLPARDSSEEQDRYEGYTPRGKYSHKRTEDPPRNADNKMMCIFSPDCHGITFERKCEWRSVFPFFPPSPPHQFASRVFEM